MSTRSGAVPMTIVGGGVWILQLIRLLVEAPDCPPLDIRLVAIDADRLSIIAGYGAKIVRARDGWCVSATTLATALEGAEVCILMLRQGNSAAREIDESFPARFGMVGDEGLGLGGFANAYRTMPTMTSIAGKMRRYAPNALTINLVAPLGLTTRALHVADVSAVGLCELPMTTEADLRATFDSCDHDLPLDYAGLNHLGWFWSPDRAPSQLFARAIAKGMADAATVGGFGAMPLKYHAKMISDRDRTIGAGASRARQLRDIATKAVEAVRQGQNPERLLRARSMPWLDQALTPLLLAVLNNNIWRGFVNIPAGQASTWCCSDTVIEARGTVSRTGGQIENVGEPGGAVRQFLAAAALSEGHLFDGFRSGDLHGGAVRAILDSPIAFPRSLVEEAAAAVCSAAAMHVVSE
ncbi:family 4 glycosyl hydrolase [Sphingomonas baiyangensis]|uniref:Glycosyl hydrolase family 4 C-terminal domain-containing protein n=1 Tax=Sphingomonas baiyangensis TaxID=2572576 RepID=A0A4U1L0W3_9SPHN|nr:hypothetical protein [Sphingomonas baiyangensis]TKD50154.1 hypothetical protein FBR43_04830 [Sphingomonas baiyangensis]